MIPQALGTFVVIEKAPEEQRSKSGLIIKQEEARENNVVYLQSGVIRSIGAESAQKGLREGLPVYYNKYDARAISRTPYVIVEDKVIHAVLDKESAQLLSNALENDTKTTN